MGRIGRVAYDELEQLIATSFGGRIAAVVRYEEEEAELRALGVNTLFNLYDGAGILLAQRALEELGLISRQGPDSS